LRFLLPGSSVTDNTSAGIVPNIFHALAIVRISPSNILHHFAKDISENPNTHGEMIIIRPMTNVVQYSIMGRLFYCFNAASNAAWNTEYG
jgi:hypothetical protein